VRLVNGSSVLISYAPDASSMDNMIITHNLGVAVPFAVFMTDGNAQLPGYREGD
jgi:hypothetical protein